MRIMPILRLTSLLAVFLLGIFQVSLAQNRTVSGRVTDPNGTPIPGVTVTVRGTNNSTQTASDGTYHINAAADAVLVFSSVGYTTTELSTSGRTNLDASMPLANSNLNEVVVIGYGTARKRDLTGSVASVQAKDFNKGVIVNPDQLIQGKVAGLQITNTSGQPGAATIVQVRGNNSIRTGNTPLFVIDGVPLDGRFPRPGLYNGTSGVGTTPPINPLNFINPSDIASIDVLKDASAAAIYGARGANGVLLITTKKGSSGASKVEAGASLGISNVMKKIKTLSPSDYRTALTTYNASKSDSGASVDPFAAILHKNAPVQTYNMAFSGGAENGRYRASFLVQDEQGIIRKSSLTKFVGNFNGQYLFLDKKLSFDYNITAANVSEKIAPISTNAGSAGNLISLGLIWNPTLSLYEPNGTFNQVNPSGQVNPLALSEAYNDKASTTMLLGSFNAGYKITPDLSYHMLYGVNYGAGQRFQELMGWIKATGSNADGAGLANVGTSQLLSQTFTHTLNYNKQITPDFSFNALAGYEYWTTTYSGTNQYAYGYDLNLNQSNITQNYHYYDNMQDANQGNLRSSSFKDPTVDLQSYFARVGANFKDRYLITATIRADGSSKFGVNNKYGYFPSVAAAWVLSNESFMKNGSIFNSLKVRAGFGQTGNQEFNPVDAALSVGTYNSNGSLSVNHFENPDLKWETVQSVDAGVDFTLAHGKVFGTIDYFNKKTINPILDFVISQPTAGSGTVFKNLDGKQAQKGWITNQGAELTLGVVIISKQDLNWSVSGNYTYVKNLFVSNDASLKSVPFVKNTGPLFGQGSSGAYSEVISPGQPIDVYYLRPFMGFSNGIAQYGANPVFSGSPNPTGYFGFSTDVSVKKFTFSMNLHGAFGYKLFNNTAMSVLNLNNIIGGRNIASNLVGNGEGTANPISPSARFLESGNYVKLGNVTVAYRVGNIGNSIRGFNIYVSGSNLFNITKYTGFDPEVNAINTLNGIPSLGVDYIGYPTARTITLGVNFQIQ